MRCSARHFKKFFCSFLLVHRWLVGSVIKSRSQVFYWWSFCRSVGLCGPTWPVSSSATYFACHLRWLCHWITKVNQSVYLCCLHIIVFLHDFWIVVLFTLILIQLNTSIRLLTLVTLLLTSLMTQLIFCKGWTTFSDRLIMSCVSLARWIKILNVNYFCLAVWACMGVSSGFLLTILLISCVFHGGNARVGYGACLTIPL